MKIGDENPVALIIAGGIGRGFWLLGTNESHRQFIDLFPWPALHGIAR